MKAISTLIGYGNLAPKVIMCLCALVLMTFSSCSDNDDDPANQPEPVDTVRLASAQYETIVGPHTITTLVSNEWKNGRLMRQTQATTTLGITVEIGEVLTYDERGLCTEMNDTYGYLRHIYTYTPDGRFAKEVHLELEDTMSITEILAYDAAGNIAEALYKVPSTSVIRKNHYTWQNGDLVKAAIEYVTEGKGTDTYTFSYDSYPSAYTGYPVALGINDVTYMAMHCSKHNLIEAGFTPSYANGRLVSLIKDDGTNNTYFTYNDGTGQR